jgi:MFS family permease
MANEKAEAISASSAEPAPGFSPAYARYVLIVLVLVYVLNFIDRQILSILAEDIKADLGLSDSDLGFLYGTVFAVFYAVFGIPLGRVSDIWVRKNMISIGLFVWSAMTALSGTAKGFASLAGYRIGVGVGESSASPAAFSLLADYFPPSSRATVLAIYSSGVYIGVGLGMVLGGVIVDGWNAAFPAGTAPFDLAGWQAAYLSVGLPGILLAVLVWTLREPVRGQSEGLVQQSERPNVLREFVVELSSVVPPLTLLTLYRVGAGARGLSINAGIGAGIVLVAAGLTHWIGSPIQWIALGVGLYAFLSWLQILARRDPATFGVIFKSRAIVFGMIGFGWHTFVGYGVSFWIPPYLLRVHDTSAGEVGIVLGLAIAVGGWLGATAGGVLSDRLKLRTPRARLYVGMASAVLGIPAAIAVLATGSLELAFFFTGLNACVSALWIGSAVALSNELVMPRMRATSGVFYILVVTFIGLALGPYSIGELSDYFAASMLPGESLRLAMFIAIGAESLACVFFWLSSRHVEHEETNRVERARAYGEPI